MPSNYNEPDEAIVIEQDIRVAIVDWVQHGPGGCFPREVADANLQAEIAEAGPAWPKHDSYDPKLGLAMHKHREDKGGVS